MDKSVLIIELPELSDEAVSGMQEFLQEFMIAFESHYFCQLQRHHRKNEEIIF